MDNGQTNAVDTYVNQLINNVVNDFLSDDEAPDIEVVEEDSVEETTVEETTVEEESVQKTTIVKETAVVKEPAVVEENNVKIDIKEDNQEDLKSQIKALELLVSNLMDKKDNAPMNEIVIEETVVEEVVKPESPVATKAKSEIPEIVIIVPYRDREPQRSAFMKIINNRFWKLTP